MTHSEMATVLGVNFNALGIPAERAAFCIPYLTGDKPIPSETSTVCESITELAKQTRLLTFPEAAKLLGCSRHTVWRMVKDGTLTPVVWRGKNKIRLAEVLTLNKDSNENNGRSAD